MAIPRVLWNHTKFCRAKDEVSLRRNHPRVCRTIACCPTQVAAWHRNGDARRAPSLAIAGTLHDGTGARTEAQRSTSEVAQALHSSTDAGYRDRCNGPFPSAHTDWPGATKDDFHLPSIAELMTACTKKHGGRCTDWGRQSAPGITAGQATRRLRGGRSQAAGWPLHPGERATLGEDAKIPGRADQTRGVQQQSPCGFCGSVTPSKLPGL